MMAKFHRPDVRKPDVVAERAAERAAVDPATQDPPLHDAPQPRTRAEVTQDMLAVIGQLPTLSPSGVETAAAQLAALVGELHGAVKD